SRSRWWTLSRQRTRGPPRRKPRGAIPPNHERIAWKQAGLSAAACRGQDRRSEREKRRDRDECCDGPCRSRHDAKTVGRDGLKGSPFSPGPCRSRPISEWGRIGLAAGNRGEGFWRRSGYSRSPRSWASITRLWWTTASSWVL